MENVMLIELATGVAISIIMIASGLVKVRFNKNITRSVKSYT